MTPDTDGQFHLGPRQIGRGLPCFVTFEAGATHDGLESAVRLTRLAAEANADAVKFQIVHPDRLVADRSQPFTYEVLVDRESGRTESVTEPLYDILCRRTLSPEEWRELKRAADDVNLAFFATATAPEDIDLLVELGCHSVKIASGDVNHWPLIRQAARTGMCLQLDTGNASLGEIEAAVDVIRAEGNENIIIHQCPSGYPARLESINLNILHTLKQMFPYPVAFSDHTPGHVMDVAAVAMGANMVEKTITLDRTTRSCEHIFSLEPADMAAFVTTIREVETALGAPRRILHAEEEARRVAVRRSTFLPNGGRRGDRLSEVAVEFRRPGTGITPDAYEGLVDRTLARDVEPDHMLLPGDLE